LPDDDWRIIGTSAAVAKVKSEIKKAAPTDFTVLVRGESGTGKELVAQELHRRSPRAARRLVSSQLGAFPPSLMASHLFGHRKGAFSGADAERVGLFTEADDSTLFLDEIGDMDPSIQVALLRVLQEGKFTRLGDEGERSVDVRLVAATNCDLEAMVKQGTFREDLYYRLDVITIWLPPLRDRSEDILTLANEFLRRYAQEREKKIIGFAAAAVHALENHTWPGNVRELENAIARAVVMAVEARIDLTDLPDSVRAGPGRAGPEHTRGDASEMDLAERCQFIAQQMHVESDPNVVLSGGSAMVWKIESAGRFLISFFLILEQLDMQGVKANMRTIRDHVGEIAFDRGHAVLASRIPALLEAWNGKATLRIRSSIWPKGSDALVMDFEGFLARFRQSKLCGEHLGSFARAPNPPTGDVNAPHVDDVMTDIARRVARDAGRGLLRVVIPPTSAREPFAYELARALAAKGYASPDVIDVATVTQDHDLDDVPRALVVELARLNDCESTVSALRTELRRRNAALIFVGFTPRGNLDAAWRGFRQLLRDLASCAQLVLLQSVDPNHGPSLRAGSAAPTRPYIFPVTPAGELLVPGVVRQLFAELCDCCRGTVLNGRFGVHDPCTEVLTEAGLVVRTADGGGALANAEWLPIWSSLQGETGSRG
jgi:MoxR-like ATPase